MSKKVSIGMPVYNGGKYLSRAIESLLNQTYDNFELIISDNASEDNTSEIIQYYMKNDKRIKFFSQKKNIGALCNFQFTLERSIGEFFFWAPHDDWWDKHFISEGVKSLSTSPDASSAIGNIKIYTPNGEEIGQINKNWELNQTRNFVRIFKHLTNNTNDLIFYALFRRDAIKKTIWSKSSAPEKVIILHALLQGGIIYNSNMEYSNQYTEKSQSYQVNTNKLPLNKQSHFLLFIDQTKELYKWSSHWQFTLLTIILFFSQKWHRFIIKTAIQKIKKMVQ
ncbi:glycosyltransferase family 2 protein [Thiothrix sp.]|jgi:glycosyltransferase involved in cell wall biosynthesis|uniref:glycosyltransferase family 2 protein n=1 Tax=Thiothrix sp. TaxID=1032 RepID=UPI00257F85A1|nr:glycosyltransferase family 2 protein [Thiothrix sp.]